MDDEVETALFLILNGGISVQQAFKLMNDSREVGDPVDLTQTPTDHSYQEHPVASDFWG